MNPITLFLAAAAGLAGVKLFPLVSPWAGAPLVLMALLITLSLKVANAWQKFVILRAGNLHSVKGPGLFLIVPVLDSVTAVIDERIQTTAFNAEQALTRDTVPSTLTRSFSGTSTTPAKPPWRSRTIARR